MHGMQVLYHWATLPAPGIVYFMFVLLTVKWIAMQIIWFVGFCILQPPPAPPAARPTPLPVQISSYTFLALCPRNHPGTSFRAVRIKDSVWLYQTNSQPLWDTKTLTISLKTQSWKKNTCG
jgi:hypothetical protein